jgi:hypothetical protein
MQDDNLEAANDKRYEQNEWRYAPWLLLELLGVAVLIWNGLPIYRMMLSAPDSQIQRPGNLILALVASALIQIGYWYRYYGHTPVLRWENAFVGHVVLFISRLAFLFAASAFSYVFIAANVNFEVSGLRYLVFFVGLFSLFCFVLELESLGRAMCERQQ